MVFYNYKAEVAYKQNREDVMVSTLDFKEKNAEQLEAIEIAKAAVEKLMSDLSKYVYPEDKIVHLDIALHELAARTGPVSEAAKLQIERERQKLVDSIEPLDADEIKENTGDFESEDELGEPETPEEREARAELDAMVDETIKEGESTKWRDHVDASRDNKEISK